MPRGDESDGRSGDRFIVEPPVWVVAAGIATRPDGGGETVAYHGLVTVASPGEPDALAVFTDEAAAEAFRDGTDPDTVVIRVDTGVRFAELLTGLGGVVPDVAFDPYKVGARVTVVAAEDLIRTLS